MIQLSQDIINKLETLKEHMQVLSKIRQLLSFKKYGK